MLILYNVSDRSLNEHGELTGEHQSTQRKTCLSASSSTTNPTWFGLRGERLATNCLSHVTTHEDLAEDSEAKWIYIVQCLGYEGMQCGKNKGDRANLSDPTLDHETEQAGSYDN